MPNIEGLGLQNFRTFKNREYLDFAPITLITGTNNAGKSTVIKAIQLLTHNLKDGIISEKLSFDKMKHELGNINRILNREKVQILKKSKKFSTKGMYSRLLDYNKNANDNPNSRPIFEEDEDFLIVFPVKFGGSREIEALLEIRYEINTFINKSKNNEVILSHSIKSVAIVKDKEYLHWSNIIGYRGSYEDEPEWEMETSIDLRKIIDLILKTSLKEIKHENFEPNKKTEEYFSIDLFQRIDKYGIGFDLPFFKSKNDNYEDFIKSFIEGKSLFSDYTQLETKQQDKLSILEQKTLYELIHGKSNSQYTILECFKNSFSNIMDGIERDIAIFETKEEKTKENNDNIESNSEENIRALFNTPMFPSTENSKLFASLMNAIEKDFLNITQKKINSFKKVYSLPTSRGRNRAWFIDEQNSADIQVVRNFSNIYLDHHSQIKDFVNFWIGKGEINQLDTKGNPISKGFKIGKELYVYRDEEIGLTKIFLVNFDGNKTPLVDLGYGVSQLLPIIMQIAIIAEKQERIHEYDYDNQGGGYHKKTIYFSPSTLLIEEPEANLHPSLQSKIAELLIDAGSRFNIQFIVETHSEYLIYKFQEYIGKKIILPNDVKMYYFNHPEDVRVGLKEKYINHVKIEKDGSIDYEKYFGTGFFDEQTNLKLSLLNIQRDRFIEDYDEIKVKLQTSNEVLKDYDEELEKLNQQLSATTANQEELAQEINEIKKAKKAKESELQQLIREQQDNIDSYTAKTNYSKYLKDIEDIIDKSKIDNSKTLQYLATGKYFLENSDNQLDFAPVVIQYGRAVEHEMIKWMKGFINSISNSNRNSWCNDINYKDKVRSIFDDLGLALDSDRCNFLIDRGINIGKKINLFHLKNYAKNNSNSYKFGNLTQVFELIYYTSYTNNSTYNYRSVHLIKEFTDYLKSIWQDYNAAEQLFNNFRSILDLRNCAGHTYTDTVCLDDIISKSTAETYVQNVEAFFKCL